MRLRRPLPNWVRWLLVVPAALAAFGVVQVLVAIILTLSPLQGLSPKLSDGAGQLVNSALGPYCFVLMGSLVAPSHRRASAITLAVLGLAIMGAVYILSSMIGGVARFGFTGWWLFVSFVLGVASSCIACNHVRLDAQRSGE